MWEQQYGVRMRIIQAKDINFNRHIIESKSVDILVSPDKNKGLGSQRYLDSGLNGVIVRLAAKNNVRIGINLSELRDLNEIELGLRFAKIRQNILLCRKAHVELAFSGSRDDISARALLMCLGASTQQATKAISF